MSHLLEILQRWTVHKRNLISGVTSINYYKSTKNSPHSSPKLGLYFHSHSQLASMKHQIELRVALVRLFLYEHTNYSIKLSGTVRDRIQIIQLIVRGREVPGDWLDCFIWEEVALGKCQLYVNNLRRWLSLCYYDVVLRLLSHNGSGKLLLQEKTPD